MSKMNKINKLMKELNINEEYTKPLKKYKYDTVKQNTFPKQDYNFMIDTLYLPETKEGYKYLLTLVDLWSDECDFEPMIAVSSKEALEAFKTIIKRKHLNMPKASIRSDNGVEFKSVFHKFLEDNKIRHRISLPYRHKQNANVENLNSLLGRVLMTYLQNQEMKTKKVYKEWTDILPQLRIKLNEIRKKPDGDPFNLDYIPYNQNESKYKIGDIVIVKYEKPHDALGYKENNAMWRKGDTRWNLKDHRKIIKILNYPNNNRYILAGLENVSFVEAELKLSTEQNELREVKKIINHTSKGGVKYYRIWFKGQLKKSSLWYKEKDLPDLKDEIKEYNDIINA